GAVTSVVSGVVAGGGDVAGGVVGALVVVAPDEHAARARAISTTRQRTPDTGAKVPWRGDRRPGTARQGRVARAGRGVHRAEERGPGRSGRPAVAAGRRPGGRQRRRRRGGPSR